MPNINKADLCASFEKTITEVLIENTEKASRIYNIDKIALAGGVSANSYIREKFYNLGVRTKRKIYYPKPVLCTDNAAMIAASAYYNYLAGNISDLTLNAVPNLKV